MIWEGNSARGRRVYVGSRFSNAPLENFNRRKKSFSCGDFGECELSAKPTHMPHRGAAYVTAFLAIL